MTPQETYQNDLESYPTNARRAKRQARKAEREAHASDHEVFLAQVDAQLTPPPDSDAIQPVNATDEPAIKHPPAGEAPEVHEPVVRRQSKGKAKGGTKG